MIRLLAFLTAALGCRIYEEEVSMRKESQRTGRSWMEMAAGSWSYTWVVPARGHREPVLPTPTVSPLCPHCPHCVPTVPTVSPHSPHHGQHHDTMASGPDMAQPAPDPLTSISTPPGCPFSLFLWLPASHNPH